MKMSITSIYAAVLTLFFVGLTIRTVVLRNKTQTTIGDAGHPDLKRAIRAHGNFAEYVPLALLLIFMVESQGAAVYWVHGLAACLLIGRVSHAYAVSQIKEPMQFRIFGMAMTLACLIGCAFYLFVAYFKYFL